MFSHKSGRNSKNGAPGLTFTGSSAMTQSYINRSETCFSIIAANSGGVDAFSIDTSAVAGMLGEFSAKVCFDRLRHLSLALSAVSDV